MIMLTPTHLFTRDEIFRTPYMNSNGIADLIIITNTHPVEGLYLDDLTLDVSINRITLLSDVYEYDHITYFQAIKKLLDTSHYQERIQDCSKGGPARFR